jgi:hypothetical protein
VSSEGTDTIRPFLWKFRIPPYWEPDNIEVLSALRSGVDPQLRWNGAAFEEGEIVTLTMAGSELRYQLECTAPATSGRMVVSITEWLKAFGEHAPKEFETMLMLNVSWEPGSRYLFPLELRNGTPAIGLVNGRFESTGSIKVSVH